MVFIEVTNVQDISLRIDGKGYILISNIKFLISKNQKWGAL